MGFINQLITGGHHPVKTQIISGKPQDFHRHSALLQDEETAAVQCPDFGGAYGGLAG